MGALVAGSAIGSAGKLEAHLAEHTALFADLLGQGASVDTVHGGNTLLLEPGAERGLSKEVRVVLAAVRGNNQASDVDLRGLEVGGQIAEKLVDGLARGHTIVTNQREGNDEDLATVRRVGNRLRVANHASLEDELSCNSLLGTEAVALVGGAILDLEADQAIVLAAAEAGGGGRGDLDRHFYGNWFVVQGRIALGGGEEEN